ncbi:hypothetical protein TraAM80_03060 [Trypanosoma rangeli]|uniref:Uncharacterized protein n=1 Tax=Trypanosoma rangeli TaxID=5698 RepID=A0A3R7KJU0_TRYRA|nr:uncharacterized protein TraAM80_03060 [Trypanosoma rangeli]RNF07912.1 hypothetical protein TraAM80_03060 [Trypanosoma rangeli]|eukprot:RNF07912.1 hypothetical protein TraAM80_03060 [Trypanosoma rangeli]
MLRRNIFFFFIFTFCFLNNIVSSQGKNGGVYWRASLIARGTSPLMELDVVSDGEVYARALQEARWDVLQGLNVERDWQQLQKRHPFFRDVVMDAGRQAKQLASVLAATEFFLQRLLWCCKNNTAPSFIDSGKVKRWHDSLAVFISLCESSPVPTQARWVAEMRQRAGGPHDCGAMSVESGEKNNGGDYNKNGGVDKDDDDDGSFVNSRLKELVTQCVAVGRMWCCQRRGEDDMSVKERRAISVMEAFAAPQTLDW